jgi:hypothetical protein
VTDRFESILDESISALQAGVPLEEILAEVPDYAAELRPLLYAASLLADPDPKPAPVERKAALRNEYMKQVTELPTITPSRPRQKMQAILRIVKRRSTRAAILKDLFTVMVTVILTLLMIAFLLTYLALETVPGDFLYEVKRFSETVQLSLAVTEAQQQALEARFNQRRLAEIGELIEQNRAAVVKFRGVLETRGENLWIVEGLTLFLPNDANVEEPIQEGDTVEVIGLLRTNNVLVVDTIRLVDE